MSPDPSSLSCADCLALASEHIDGQLRPIDAARVEAHVVQCSTCARYFRVLCRGLELARELPVVQPSPEFQWRLDRRLRQLDDVMAERQLSARSGAALAVAVAGVVAILAWSPILTPAASQRPLASAEPPKAYVAPAEPEGWEWWYSGVEPAEVRQPNANNAFPGPYSPLYIEPPLGGGGGRARTVLASLIHSE